MNATPSGEYRWAQTLADSKRRCSYREGYGMQTQPHPRAVIYDAIGWCIFLIAGIASHNPSGGNLASAIASSAIVAAAWFSVAAITHFYEQPVSLLLTARTWIAAGSIGLILRTLLRWRALVPAFATVTILLGAVVLLLWRAVLLLAQRTRTTAPSQDV